jgi:type IV secretion system protein VirB9
MKIRMMVVVASLWIFSALAIAGQGAEQRDPRILVEQYDPNHVVRIYTKIGNPTLVQFEDDEQIVNTPQGMVGMGDAKAWVTKPKGSNIMLKPKAAQPDTTMLVVTTKRTYAFEIVTVPSKSRQAPTLIVRFDYPDTKAKQSKAEAAKQAVVAERLQEIAREGHGEKAAGRNRKYMKRGDEVLAPSEVEDDGRFTYMKFDSTSNLPLVYTVQPSGKEALTNFHIDPDSGTMVIHETAPLFMLRYGDSVMAIRNDGFSPKGNLNLTGSTLPRTLRLLKDAQQ